MELPDGTYLVRHGEVSWAGAVFVVEGGKVTQCAPILRRRFEHWLRFAEQIFDKKPLFYFCDRCGYSGQTQEHEPDCGLLAAPVEQ